MPARALILDLCACTVGNLGFDKGGFKSKCSAPGIHGTGFRQIRASNASASIYRNVLGGGGGGGIYILKCIGGGGGGGVEKRKERWGWKLGTLQNVVCVVPDCTTVSTQCETCPSCSTSPALASVIRHSLCHSSTGNSLCAIAMHGFCLQVPPKVHT